MSEVAITPLGPRGDEAVGRPKRRLTLVLLVIAAAARIPFLWHGFGGHPDEWLVVRSGLDLWLHGSYYPSRVPGYPLDEMLMGGLARLGGATACAAAATVASLVTLAYMRGLAPLYGIRNSFWMVLAFSFEPWVWSSGTHGLDYIWGTGSLVAALYYTERRQFAAAGLACAVGFGFRPSSLLWIIPVFVRVLIVRRNWREVLRFSLWAALPALIPTAMIIRVMLTRPDVWAGQGAYNLKMLESSFIPLSLLAVYHFLELLGFISALVIAIACFRRREKLTELFRSGEGWIWIVVLIFVCLLPTFVLESGKTEYMLPALPGLFMILGRCLTDNWWKGLTAAFVVSAFVSLGFGHAPHPGGLRIAMAVPTLRPGALLWYAAGANASSDRVRRIGSELTQTSRIVHADPDMDRLDDFYVSSLLKRGPASQARISCPLVPAFLSFWKDQSPQISPSAGLPKARPSQYPILVCCRSKSGLVLSSTPSVQNDALLETVRGFCEPVLARGPQTQAVR